jgi:RNA polymerase sigma-70 factor, ECF subfamily
MDKAYEDWLVVLEQLQRGDPIAVIKLTRVITGFLTRYQAYTVRDSWDDLCQEVLMALLKSAEQGRINEPKAIINYIGIITRNKLTDWVKRQQKAGDADLLGDPEVAASLLDSHHHESIDADLLLDLQQAITTLNERDRSVVEAIYIQGHSYQAAANLLDMPLGTLKRIQVKALKTLRGIILEPTGPP